MKVLKILVISFVSLLVLLIAGFLILVNVVDVNQYVPALTAQVSSTLGRELKVGRVNLGFSPARGFSLEARDLVLSDDPKFSAQPFMTVAKVAATVDIKALLFEHKIQVAGILVDSPRISLIRSKAGVVNAATMAVKAGAPAATGAVSPGSASAAALPAFLVRDIKIRQAMVSYADDMFAPPVAVRVDRIDVDVRDLSLTAPFPVVVKAALFSSEEDVVIHGLVRPDLARGAVQLEKFSVLIHLAGMDPVRMAAELPMLKPMALGRCQGDVAFSFDSVMVGASGLTGLKGQVQVSMASMVSGLLPLALTRIQAEADLDEKKINVRSFSATIAEGLIEGNVQVDDFMAVPAISAVFSISGVVPQKFMEAYKVPVKVSGILSGDGNIKCSGKAPEEIMGSLSGNFKAELKGGVLENMNLLSLGLGKVPLLPGLLDSVMMDLPLETKEDIAKGITRFDTCRASARIAGLALEDILAKITTRDLAVEAGGVLRLVEGFNMTADIRIAPDLSARLAGKASDLRALEDKEGRIYMPLNISGGLTTPKVMPDVGYLTEKILAARGGAQVQQILEGSPGTREAVNAIFDIFKKK